MTASIRRLLIMLLTTSGHELVFLLCPGRWTEYCNQFVCVSVCLPWAYLWNCWTVLLWRHCDMDFWFYGWHHIWL